MMLHFALLLALARQQQGDVARETEGILATAQAQHFGGVPYLLTPATNAPCRLRLRVPERPEHGHSVPGGDLVQPHTADRRVGIRLQRRRPLLAVDRIEPGALMVCDVAQGGSLKVLRGRSASAWAAFSAAFSSKGL
jgi:hypothetical protein